MRPAFLWLPVLIAVFQGCSTTASERSPEDVFKRVQAAISRRDWNDVYELIAPSRRLSLEKEWEVERSRTLDDSVESAREVEALTGLRIDAIRVMSAREYFVAVAPRAEWGIVGDDIVSTRLDGDRCTLTLKSKGSESTLRMARENGQWYVIVD